MSSEVLFTPLYGTDQYGALCYLLEIDGAKLLLDCGWDHRFQKETIQALHDIDLKEIQGVILSHSDIHHLGALPYCFAKLGLNCPVYCTYPIWRMGFYSLYDAFQGIMDEWCDFDLFSLDDIDECFSPPEKHFIDLSYIQPIKILDDLVTLTPYRAGHTIGGACWKLSKDTEDILYAVDYNHHRERHLNESWVMSFVRPSLFITDCVNFTTQTLHKRKDLDVQLLQTVVETCGNNGNVLIPTDAGGRCFELLFVLYNFWKKQDLFRRFRLAFLSHTASHARKAVELMLEWTNDDCKKKFDEDKRNVFKWSKLIVARNLQELQKLAQPPVCVLATNPYCEHGFSQKLFEEWCSNTSNCVILTQKVPPASISGKLLEVMEKRRKGLGVDQTVTYKRRRKVRLQGEELQQYLEKKRKEEEEERERKRQAELAEADSSDEEMEELDQELKPVTVQATFPMFNWFQPNDEQDVYGAPMDFSIYEDLPDKISQKQSANGESVEDMEEDEEETPFKSIVEDFKVTVRCKIRYYNFEGRIDGKSLRLTIQQYMQPKKVIVVKGSEAGRQQFADFCNNLSNPVEAHVPAIKETITVSSTAKICSLLLEHALDEQCNFVKIQEDYEVCYIQGMIAVDGSTSQRILTKVGKNDRKKFLPRKHGALFLGDPKLIDIKQKLTKEGQPSRFVLSSNNTGTLVAGKNNNLRIEKKRSNTNWKYKGVLSADYFAVRDTLYSSFDVL